jgi:predicted transcriptional regulator
MSAQAPSNNHSGIGQEAMPELKLISNLFHQINRVLPEQQKLLSFPPDMSAADAVALLQSRGFSQAPVVIGGSVLGIFSYRSFSLKCAEFSASDAQKEKRMPNQLTVEECLEQFDYVRITEEIERTFDAMERDNGVLVGTPELLQGVLTPMDFLRYLYKIAIPFVMISEIELTLRALMTSAVTPAELAECATRVLAQHYGVDNVPQSLENMTFDNYRAIISHGANWPKFEPVLGVNRARVAAKLAQIGEIRNDVFHFKREITVKDHDVLAGHRDWLLLQARKVDLRKKEGGHD